MYENRGVYIHACTTHYPVKPSTGICVCDVEMYTPPPPCWTGIHVRASDRGHPSCNSSQRGRDQMRRGANAGHAWGGAVGVQRERGSNHLEVRTREDGICSPAP